VLAAIRALLAHRRSDVRLDLPVLVRGAGVTGSCIITALLEVAIGGSTRHTTHYVSRHDQVLNTATHVRP